MWRVPFNESVTFLVLTLEIYIINRLLRSLVKLYWGRGNALKGPVHIKNSKRALEIGALWGPIL